jgi:hypothetical protein
MVKRAKNWGILMYILAGVASVALPVVLSATPRSAETLFPEPKYDDVIRVLQAAYR